MVIELTDDDLYITCCELKYKNINIPKGFKFDGVTVKMPFTLIFSNDDLRKGIIASCFHDYMCKYKNIYKRKYATDILIELWKEKGLSNIKCNIVRFCVNTYQYFNGWK